MLPLASSKATTPAEEIWNPPVMSTVPKPKSPETLTTKETTVPLALLLIWK